MNSKLQDRLLDVKQVQNLTSASRASIWRWEGAGKFPKRIRIGRAIRWRESDIQKWISELQTA